jgi:PadR family transcriptional regulator, regulatory protein PadR
VKEPAPRSSAPTPWSAPVHCRFELSPPRHFVYPAILLFLSEKPRHGYRLMDPIAGLGLGAVDRPTVYRALADLERDGLVEKWDAEPKAGATRHVYAVTEAGRQALEHWMAVLATERDQLDRVVERYALLSHPRQPARTESPSVPEPLWPVRRLALPDLAPDPSEPADPSELADPPAGLASVVALDATPTHFAVDPELSAILIRARSNVGTIEFGTTGVRGQVEAAVRDGAIVGSAAVTARLEVDVASLTSGNSLYDAELMHRVHARLFPLAVVELEQAAQLASDDRFQIGGRLTFHGVTAPLDGAVSVTVLGQNKLVVSGEKVIDIRDFEIAAPAMLMLKIYPDVRVFLHVEARAEKRSGH